MISKAQYLYAKKKKDDLKLRLADFEAHNPVYLMWQKWLVMTPDEQDKLIGLWNNYYISCRLSYYGLQYNLAATAWKQDDMGMVRSIARFVINSKAPMIRKPSTEDPRDLERMLVGLNYFAVVEAQRNYEEQYEEYKDVYEPRRGGEDDSL